MMSLAATTAVALILGFAAIASGALMYWLRGGMRGGAPPSRRYLVWERSFIMAAVVLTAAELVLLADLLAAADGAAAARAGAVAYLFGGVLIVGAEASSRMNERLAAGVDGVLDCAHTNREATARSVSRCA